MKNPCFMLTGFEKEERLYLINIIKQMNGVFIYNPADSQAFLPGCTHMIAKRPCKSLKFLSAVASGKWILTSDYLTHSKTQGRWVDEEEYEWVSNQSSPGEAVELFEAPRRWRNKLTVQNAKPPFCGWRVGLEAPRADVSTYKRLVEIGGGLANPVQEDRVQSYTHILVHPKHKRRVRHLHDAGIPCLPIDYIAQYLLEDPPPSTSSCSVFATTPGSSSSRPDLSVDTKCFVKLTKCDELLSPTSFNSLITGTSEDSLELQKSGKRIDKIHYQLVSSEDEEDIIVSDEASAVEVSSSSSSLDEEEEGKSASNERKITDDLSKSTLPTRRYYRLSSSDSVATITISDDEDPPPPVKEVISLPIFVSDESDSEGNVSNSSPMEDNVTSHGLFEKLAVGYESTEISGSNPTQSKLPSSKADLLIPSKTSPDDQNVFESKCGKLDVKVRIQQTSPSDVAAANDVDMLSLDSTTRRRSICNIAVPPGLNRLEIERFFQNLSNCKKTRPSDDVVIDCDAFDDDDAPSRFGKMEMSMVERFAEAGHSRSVLYICKKLLSSQSYPPPDLLFLIMKKYVLESHDENESNEALGFLDSTLLHHPPSSTHIRQDDVYGKAMATTFSTESSLLTSTKVNLHVSSFMWNRPQAESHEWSFFSKTLKQALSCSDIKRRKAAVVLLSFFTNVLEQDEDLLHKMIWSRSKSIRQTSALRSLLKRYRAATESLPTSSTTEDFCPAKDEDIIEEDILEEEANEVVESTEQHKVVTTDELSTQTCMCLSRIVTSVCEKLIQDHLSSIDVIVQCTAETFQGAKKSTLDWVFRDLPSVVTLGVSHLMLNRSCKPEWLKSLKTDELTLHQIVNELMFSVPRTPGNIAKEWTPTKQTPQTSTAISHFSEQNESSDKENFQSEKRSSESDSASSCNVTRTNINKRNPKGETQLHRACIQNQPSRVAELLAVIGVDPNARDHAGWTPLSEACNLGHLECAKELLRLPVADRSKANIVDIDRLPAREIDLLACPEEGITPLHDALTNAHIEVARLLIEKGGVELLYIADKQGKTPLDVCMNDNVRCLVLEIACHIAANSFDSQSSPHSVEEERKDFHLPADEDYMKVLPPSSLLTTEAWRETCTTWMALIRHLLISYADSTKLHDVINYLARAKKEDDSFGRQTSIPFVTSLLQGSDVRKCRDRAESDIGYVLKWPEVEATFLQHVRKIMGDNNLTLNQEYTLFSHTQLMRVGDIIDNNTVS